MPSAHGWQTESPSWDLYVPASHAVHKPRTRVKPLEQKQSEAEVAPATDVSCSPQVSAQISFPRSGLNVPGSHGAQTESTWLIGKKPATHSHSSAPSSEDVRLGHALHLDMLVAPSTVEYVSEGQREHTVGPASTLYVPAAQGVHMRLPVYPGIHLQSVTVLLPFCEVEWRGHGTHTARPFPMSASEKVPAGHSLQNVEPVPGLILPAGQL